MVLSTRSPTAAAVGFFSIRPPEAVCVNGPTADTLKVAVLNTMGAVISNVSLRLGSTTAYCADRLAKGAAVTCEIPDIECGLLPGERFEADITISYYSIKGMPKRSAGQIRGVVE